MASLSQRVIVYKGQLTSHQVREYFTDLSQKSAVSAFGLVHSRFATNTFPSWKLAQPFRYIAHNGEINTLQGNLNWLNEFTLRGKKLPLIFFSYIFRPKLLTQIFL